MIVHCIRKSSVKGLRLMAGLQTSTKFKVCFVLGPPGAGKGTECTKISESFSFKHLSAGDLLRAEQEREGSEFGSLIKKHIRDGTIVPVEITCKLLENAMVASKDSPGFLIDGFPRNDNNLEGWQREMSNKTHLLFVLFLDCPEEICVKRCLGRNQGRADDNEDSLKKRIQTYISQTKPVIDYYARQELVRHVDSSKAPDEVHEQVKKIFAAAI